MVQVLIYLLILIIRYIDVYKRQQILIARRNGEGRYKDVGPVMIQGGTFLLGLAVLLSLIHI